MIMKPKIAMSNRWYIPVYLVAALIFFLLSENIVFLFNKISLSEPNFKKVEKAIQVSIDEAEDYSQMLLEKSKRHGVGEAFRLYSDSLSPILTEKGISVYLFRNEKLVFWSKSLDISNLNEDSTKYFVKNIQNAWYVGRWVTSKSDKVLALLLLKHNYPYQNKFLSNSYNHKIKELEGYNITTHNDDNARKVHLSDGTTIGFEKKMVKNNKLTANVKSILQWIALLLFIIAIITFYQRPYFKKYSIFLFLLIVSVVTIRVLSLMFGFPSSGLSELFSPGIFAHSVINPSLGDFLVNALLFFMLVVFAYKRLINHFQPATNKYIVLWGVVLSMVVWTQFIITDNLFASLVMHSTITFETYRIFNLSIYSLIGYIAISLWFISSLLLADLWIKSFKMFLGNRRSALIALLGFIIAFALMAMIGYLPSIYGALWAVSGFCVLLWLRYKGLQLSAPWFLLMLGLLSLYSVLLVSDYTYRKDQDVRKVLAINLSNERDPVAEVLFNSLVSRMESDTIIHDYIDNIQKHDIEMFGYLQNNYFNGYFKKYDFRATVCYPGSDLIMDNTDSKVDCNGFFNDIISVFGVNIPGSNFYFLNMQNGRINYIGYADCQHSSKSSRLYIELDSKFSPEQFGYPELLLEGKLINKSKLSVYSTAKYYQNQLLAQTGNFPYRLVSSFKLDSTQKFNFINQGGYNHLIYGFDTDDYVVLSRPRETILNTTASFAYVFIFFGIIMTLWLSITFFPLRIWNQAPSFKKRIKTAMILIVFLSLILVASVSIVYSINSFENKSIDNLSEKVLSVMIEIDRDFGKEEVLTPANSEYLSSKLVQLSNIFYSDINLYDVYGVLLASSRPEIFERQLQGKRMNPEAWHEMAYRNSQKLIHKERIGEMTFLSAYVPLVDQNGNIIAYLNLPYFTRQSEFVAELYSIIVAIINIYTLITLFALVLAIVISNQISQPLELIREKIRNVDISGHNEPIRYSANDELGQLVKEYNRMVLELADSAEKLARSQRESAWREMAKQIAHEIKNPLTPMKLSIQHLVKAKRDGSEDWDSMFQKFSVSLVDQINSLSNIATEFSNFAKMPVTSVTAVNMNLVIDEVLTLFSGYSNIKFSYINSCGSNTSVDGDREQLFRVFVNLVKNAVQSIEKGKKGEINIMLSCREKTVTILIEDNGRGIPDDIQPKLFSPNFTTKSGGMGLGLAIVKGIIENNRGRIWFETELGLGTKFFVELPMGDNIKA